jgi:TRAP-type uncharacterized transport system substrate-binding protein
MASINFPNFNNNNASIKTANYNNFVLGMLTAFFTIILVFLLLAMKNIYILLGFFTTTEIIILWYAISNNKKIYPAIILFVVGILIIFWQYKSEITDYITNLFKNKQNVNENFYTLFTPFSLEQNANIDLVSLSNTTSDLLKTRITPLILGYQENDEELTTFVAKLFLSKAKILNINLISNPSPEEICNQTYLNNVNIALLPAPIINKAYNGNLLGFEGTKMNNLQFIANVQHHYLFCISTIASGVQNIHQLVNRRVGIPPRLKSMWLDIEKSIFPNGHSITFTYDNEYKLIQDLKDFKLDSVFYAGQYPNQFINDVISSEISSFYQLVPIMFDNEDYFLKQNRHYRKSILKLSYDYMPSIYLPTGIGRIWQTEYTPDYWTLGYDISLISNNYLDNFTGYEIAKTIYLGRKLIIRNTSINHLVYIGDPFTPADIASPTLPDLPVQEGTKRFYIEKGMISYCNNPQCIETVGIKKCSLCNKK